MAQQFFRQYEPVLLLLLFLVFLFLFIHLFILFILSWVGAELVILPNLSIELLGVQKGSYGIVLKYHNLTNVLKKNRNKKTTIKTKV